MGRNGHRFRNQRSWIALCLAGAVLWAGSVAALRAQSVAGAQQVIAPIILDVPFISQREQNCGLCGGMENCGPASLAMVLQAYGCAPVASSATELVHTMRKLMTGKENQCGQGGTGFDQMSSAIRQLPASLPDRCRELGVTRLELRPAQMSVDLKAILDQVHNGVPVIVAVDGSLLSPSQTTKTAFDSDRRHLLVVTGYDAERVYVNDPLYRRSAAFCTPSEGSWYYTRESWEKAVAAHGDGAVAVGPGLIGPLEVLQSLSVAGSVRPGETVTVHFRLRNRGSETITLTRLGVACRGPQVAIDKDNMAGARQWGADGADLAFVEGVHLAPGQEYEYRQSRSFDENGGYFAALTYADASGFVHTLTGPVEFTVGGNAVPQYDAALLGRSALLIAVANGQVAASLQLRNTGSADWRVGQGYALQNVNDQPLGSPARVELAVDTPAGTVASWSLSLQAPSTPGVYRSEWRMVQGSQPFGATVTVELRVLGVNPSGWFERLRQDLDRRLAEWRAAAQRQIEEAIQKELERQLRSICGGGLIAPGLLLATALWLSDHARGSSRG